MCCDDTRTLFHSVEPVRLCNRDERQVGEREPHML